MQPQLNGKVQLKGQIGERNLEFGLDLDASESSSSRDETLPIHRLAAKAQIKQLQDAGKGTCSENSLIFEGLLS